jgi:hypothetical protein
MNAELQLVMSNSETLTGRQWASLIGITTRAFNMRGVRESHQKDGRRYFGFDALPLTWQLEIEARREAHRAKSFRDLIEISRIETRWAPARKWESYPKSTRLIAEKRKAALSFYYRALDEGRTKEVAKQLAMRAWDDLFSCSHGPVGRCSERTIRNWVELIDKRGGFEFAPMEAYCDGKSCAHKKAQLTSKLPAQLGLTEEQFEALAKEIKARSVKCEHISAVHHALKLDWLMGREVPGLGVRGSALANQFPLTKRHVRAFVASTGARRLGSHGNARFTRECAPWVHTSVATLRPLELIVLDDTRIDSICHDDLNPSRLIELKAYLIMDVATRRILGFTVKEGSLGKEDVSALFARVLRGFGLPSKYPMHIIFERGAVACAPAAETLLTSLWPGRIVVHRTSMDGGNSTVASFWESRSGHWMGKPWIESFMRTLAILLERLPGQRGGDYRRQPAMLGFKGREHSTGRLLYDKGGSTRRNSGILPDSSDSASSLSTQMHEAALTAFTDLAIQWIDGGLGKDNRPRLKSSPLRPKRWVIEQIAETVALYNNETDHEREGFARIEFQCPKSGALKHRMESSNERWNALSQGVGFERIHPADAASLLRWRGRSVTVDARTGVQFDLAPFKGLRFWKPESICCHLAAQLATQEKKMVALYDAEAFRTWRPDCGWALEVHMICDVNTASWKAGDEGRYVETLQLYGAVDRMDAAAMAQAAADKARVVRRMKLELVQAAGPSVLRQLADLEEDEAQLRGVIARMDLERPQLPQSDFTRSVAVGAESAEFVTRREQQRPALSKLEAFQAAHANPTTDSTDDMDPEIF